MNETLVILGCANKRVSQERALAGLVLARKKKINRIILSGGLGENNQSEARMMYEYMHKNCKYFRGHVKCILEEKSTNTAENFGKINEIENGAFFENLENYLLLSSRSHIYRLRGALKGIQKISAEPILSSRIAGGGKTQEHHKNYWTYEIMRPLIKRMPQRWIKKRKEWIKKR